MGVYNNTERPAKTRVTLSPAVHRAVRQRQLQASQEGKALTKIQAVEELLEEACASLDDQAQGE